MKDLIGQSLGRYHIFEQLGEGGMATVYKAYDTRLEREVAVKVIRTDQFGSAVLERILKRFEREAKSLARLSHPNIVHINDYGEHESVPYLVMDYLPGGTLKERLGKPWPWQEAARLLLPVASALAYAHRQGIIHRDVKPNNILMAHSGDPMLTDFGIAKLLDTGETQTLTGSGVGIGTPEYMAPEQGLGKEIDGRADIYALGVVFYEMVTGKKPFTADTPMAVVIMHVSDPLPRPSEAVPDLPEAVERVLIKALAKKPENRYADMDAVCKVLEALLTSPMPASGPVLASIAEKPGREMNIPSTPEQTAINDVATIDELKVETPVPKPAPVRPAWKTRSFGLWIGAGVVVIALVSLLVGWLARGQANPIPKPDQISTPVAKAYIETASPLATSIVEPSPTNTLPPEPTSTPSATNVTGTATQGMEDTLKYGSLLYQDNFDNDTGGWALHQGSLIKNGELILPPGSSATIPNWDGRYSNFIFEAKFRFINPEQVHYTSVYLRLADPPCPAGNCSTQVFVSSGRNIAAWNFGSQIKQVMNYTDAPQLDPNTYNTLAVVANGDNFSVFINSVFVRSFSDNTYTTGIIVLDADGASSAYDYIRIYSLP